MSKQTHILTVHENGSITTLYTEAIPYDTIGTLTVKRASSVEFNEDDQMWEVTWAGDNGPVDSPGVVYRNPSRAECIAWEIRQLNGKV